MYNSPFLQEQIKAGNINFGTQVLSFNIGGNETVEFDTRTDLDFDEIVGLYFNGDFYLDLWDIRAEIICNGRIIFKRNTVIPYLNNNNFESVFWVREVAKGSTLRIRLENLMPMFWERDFIRANVVLITAKYKKPVPKPTFEYALETVLFEIPESGITDAPPIPVPNAGIPFTKDFDFKLEGTTIELVNLFGYYSMNYKIMRRSTIDLYIDSKKVLNKHDLGMFMADKWRKPHEVCLDLNLTVNNPRVNGTFYHGYEEAELIYGYRIWLALVTKKKL